MKSTLLVGALGALLVIGASGDSVLAQAKAPADQPTTEAAPPVPEGELILGTVRLPRKVLADGKPLPAGTYRVRLTNQKAAGTAPGATSEYERFVEFLQGNEVKGREVASIIPDADIAKVADGAKPRPNSSKVEMLRGNEFLRVWINRGGNHFLIHLPTQTT
ncbi:MAG TPA: hypothetical protein VIL35_16150 [Vicinamibacterales bacterium]